MNKLTIVAGGTETTFLTEMEQKDFEQAVNNVSVGYERLVGFLDEKGARVFVNPSNVACMRFKRGAR